MGQVIASNFNPSHPKTQLCLGFFYAIKKPALLMLAFNYTKKSLLQYSL